MESVSATTRKQSSFLNFTFEFSSVLMFGSEQGIPRKTDINVAHAL